MSCVATVVIPTHDHSPLLRLALGSVQAQTVRELEIFVIGDGVPDETRELVAELAADDPRIRFFDHPKGARHGESYRHEALAEAQGAIVCYQADDDLWFPGHVEELRRLLQDADFAHSLALDVDADVRRAVFPWLAALESRVFRAVVELDANVVPMSVAAHTLAAYRALPHGWQTTPLGTPTDLYFYRQLLAQPGIRVASGGRPTALHFPSTHRKGWTLDQRLAELERWAGRVAGPEWRYRHEPLLVAWCAEAEQRLRRRLRLLAPVSRLARTPGLLGALPRRVALELWGIEIRRVRRRARRAGVAT